MATNVVTDATFEADVLNSSEPVVVDFWAEWCGPCKMIAPALEEISTELNGQVKIAKLNIDENQNTPSSMACASIPTLIVFKGGEPSPSRLAQRRRTSCRTWIKARPDRFVGIERNQKSGPPDFTRWKMRV